MKLKGINPIEQHVEKLEGLIAKLDEKARRKSIENHFKWIAAAKFLGCHAIRVNAGGGGTPEEQMARAADSLHRLAVISYGESAPVIDNSTRENRAMNRRVTLVVLK